ncbi:16S rRNA (cytosine(1402)-N(4))-methyltransferase RsmH [Hydrogenobacter hydrogenophilus]|uniref:Ribosomal RNA small subunit methyltransferase H n=1 Tax=Hydrogenobacter hydrogenophilus TaxID=35835 RepID=A0A285P6K6_9AQUI|nr:16S rRNA (cytosine(1402)-N(4))-methyltransferase RsmH [Hydrogenobacter hydrogenophilus]SNZ15766.1 16S rRNA (cytosine1402-N4)-methyltransferase [Hydrogenobacter hydrogenophilus]
MHVPVLLKETLEILVKNRGGVYVDCTVGLGGHTKGILQKDPTAYVIGIDRDPYALKLAKENLKDFEGRYSLYQANFKDLDQVLKEEGIKEVDGFLFDLGVSMLQLKSDRGFSFQRDEPLDMRMNPEDKKTAYQVVNTYSEKELARIFREYGEERYAEKIAKAIVVQRAKKPIETTAELVQIILSVIPYRYGKIHPATKVFQALRIEVNQELASLEIALEKTIPFLKKGGRLVVISFHSLEDRIVKNFFKKHADTLKVLTKKPIRPTIDEVKRNPASRSAKLRAGEKI